MRCGTELALKEKVTSLLSPHTMVLKVEQWLAQKTRYFFHFFLPNSPLGKHKLICGPLYWKMCITLQASPYFMLVDWDLNAQKAFEQLGADPRILPAPFTWAAWRTTGPVDQLRAAFWEIPAHLPPQRCHYSQTERQHVDTAAWCWCTSASHPFHWATQHSLIYPRETSGTPQGKAKRLFVNHTDDSLLYSKTYTYWESS